MAVMRTMHTRGSRWLGCARVLGGLLSISGFLWALDVFLRLSSVFLAVWQPRKRARMGRSERVFLAGEEKGTRERWRVEGGVENGTPARRKSQGQRFSQLSLRTF